MDKRWIYIIIILIIGISALYFIVSSSNTVGSAIVDVNKFLITLPDDFNIQDTDREYSILINRNTNAKIIIKDLGKGNSINERLQNDSSIYHDRNYMEIKNKSFTHDDVKIKEIYGIDEENNINSTAYFMKFNHTFNIKTNNFHDIETIDSNVEFIIDTLQIDYKQSQD